MPKHFATCSGSLIFQPPPKHRSSHLQMLTMGPVAMGQGHSRIDQYDHIGMKIFFLSPYFFAFFIETAPDDPADFYCRQFFQQIRNCRSGIKCNHTRKEFVCVRQGIK
ncbi:MAG: hypothetical protein H6860_02295 [Rhodospirillales bacterium]|nr:hypothetical protein [Rhodospirillales bacterium]